MACRGQYHGDSIADQFLIRWSRERSPSQAFGENRSVPNPSSKIQNVLGLFWMGHHLIHNSTNVKKIHNMNFHI